MICFPLDNVEYEAKALGAWFSSRTRGVLSAEGNLSVSAQGGMSISVQSGIAWLKMSDLWGAVCMQESPIQLTCQPADSDLSRIDAICCRLDKNTNTAEIMLKKGTPAVSPSVPVPQRDIDADEIFIAGIRISPGATEITSADITDLRLDESVCGLVRDGITAIPTDTLNSQAQAMIEEYRRQTQKSLESLSAAVSEITAGNGTMTKIEYDPNSNGVDVTNQNYTHTSLSALAGNGANGYFKAAFTGTVTSISIGSTTYIVKNKTATSINLVADTVYSFILVDNTINFIGGENKTLIWQNASFGSTFLPQTIPLDLSGYDFVDVEYTLIFTGGRQYTSTKRCNIVDSASPIGYILDGMSANDVDLQMYLISRHCKPLATGVVFNGAISVLFRSGGAGYTIPIISNSGSIPSKIYGGNY